MQEYNNVVCLKCNSNFQNPGSPTISIKGSQAFLNAGNMGLIGGELKCSGCGERHECMFYNNQFTLSLISVPIGFRGLPKVIVNPVVQSSQSSGYISKEEAILLRSKNTKRLLPIVLITIIWTIFSIRICFTN